MKRILLSVAHAPQSVGVEAGGLQEYSLSKAITERVAEDLHLAGIPCSLIDVGGLFPDRSYSWIKKEKVYQIDQIAAKAGEQGQACLAIELHLQRGGGVACLYWHSNATSRRDAESLLQALEDPLGGRHWKEKQGHIPCPNAAYWQESPGYVPFFVGQPATQSMIVELGSILRGLWWVEKGSFVSAAIASALRKVAEQG